jgi:hypothetical protein
VAKAEPTPEELRSAWQQCVARRRSVWPATFDEAMADPLLSRLVRITALHPPRASTKQRLRAGSVPAPRVPLTSRTTVDRKRAAAGDRDD